MNLNKPSLLILDEPTNHLDTISIIFLLKQLKLVPFAPIVLVVRHHKLMIDVAE